jgi:hypothetical protein
MFLGKKAVGKYATWQEASEAARRSGFKTIKDYKKGYKKDARLPQDPYRFYKGCPAIEIFLDTAKYPNWEQASKAAQELGFRTRQEYWAGYKQDVHLVRNPVSVYPDLPNWAVFLHCAW